MFRRQITVTELSARPSLARIIGTPTISISSPYQQPFCGSAPVAESPFRRASDVRLDQVEQLADNSRNAGKCPGRLAPSSMVERPGTSTRCGFLYRSGRSLLPKARKLNHFTFVQLFAVLLQGPWITCRSSGRSNCIGLTKILTTTTSRGLWLRRPASYGRRAGYPWWHQRHALTFHTQAADLLTQQRRVSIINTTSLLNGNCVLRPVNAGLHFSHILPHSRADVARSARKFLANLGI